MSEGQIRLAENHILPVVYVFVVLNCSRRSLVVGEIGRIEEPILSLGSEIHLQLGLMNRLVELKYCSSAKIRFLSNFIDSNARVDEISVGSINGGCVLPMITHLVFV